MKKILSLFFVFSFLFSVAQNDGLPVNPDPGKCYVKCVTQDEFKDEVVKIMVSPEYKVLTVIPATYKWVEKEVLVKEASVLMIYHPAKYEWAEVPFNEKENAKVLAIAPATFGVDSERIEIFPKTGKWEYASYTECESPNPEDCRTLCYIEKLPVYVNVPLQTLENDAQVIESTNPGSDAVYKKQVVAEKAWVEEVEIPAEYDVIKMQVVDVPASVQEETIAAVYETVTKKVLVKKGGVSSWEEIDCGLVRPNDLDIYWDLNSAKLREESKAKIDEVLLTLLNERPNLNIELSSHTDSRGTDDFNLALSQRRADAVKSYLVSKGINANRLISKGYGETRLLNNCSNDVECSASDHQINRRTEYKIIGN